MTRIARRPSLSGGVRWGVTIMTDEALLDSVASYGHVLHVAPQ